jgi:hypothetical protein
MYKNIPGVELERRGLMCALARLQHRSHLEHGDGELVFEPFLWPTRGGFRFGAPCKVVGSPLASTTFPVLAAQCGPSV